MVRRASHPQGRWFGSRASDTELPRPTLRFRLEAWRAFQRALDPLGKPRPYRPPH